LIAGVDEMLGTQRFASLAHSLDKQLTKGGPFRG
jgi:hypothetical protein